MNVDDLQGMSGAQADEYLFGQYQQAKRRWRRFTGKPVRALRRTVRKKGKGKGKRNSYLNLSDLLQSSSYFKGKGKGGKSSGKGFGRKTNLCGRDGEPLKCSICGSAYHLRARCPRQDSSAQASQTAQGSSAPAAPSFAVHSANLHFASFEQTPYPPSDASWANIPSPRSTTSTVQPDRTVPGTPQSRPLNLLRSTTSRQIRG